MAGSKYGPPGPAANHHGDLTAEDRVLLGQLLGLDKPVHPQGVSIPDSKEHYMEYIDRAEGRTPRVIGTRYWE